MDLEVTEVGSGDDLVVLVHGVLDRGSSFDRVANLLDSECRMLWYDRRGYGQSVGLGEPVGVDGHIADLISVLDGRPAVVVGHSFGGVTAMGTAVAAPELVRALVLYETSTAWVPAWDDTVLQGIFGAEDPEEAALRLMLGDRYDTLSDADRAQRRREASAFLAEEQSVRGGRVPYNVAELHMPVVYGRSDARVMPVVVDHLREEVPDFEIVTIPGAGHNAHRTAPEAFADLVRRGLELQRV
jgi:pimeloyl-ACP methyl ester carboxylesterase